MTKSRLDEVLSRQHSYSTALGLKPGRYSLKDSPLRGVGSWEDYKRCSLGKTIGHRLPLALKRQQACRHQSQVVQADARSA